MSAKIALSLVQFFNAISMVSGNTVLASVILWTKNLRSRHELLLIAGLAIADCIYGGGYLLGSLQEFYRKFNDHNSTMTTPWKCYLEQKVPFFIVGSQTAALMQVMLSLDRLIAVRWFQDYLTLDVRYALRILVCVYGYVLCSLVGIGFVSYNFTNHTSPSVPDFCFSTSVATKGFRHYQPAIQMSCGVLSCLIYLATAYFYRSHIAHVNHGNGGSAMQLQRQKRITKLVGMTTLGTCFTYVIPHATILIINNREWFTTPVRTNIKLAGYTIGNYNSILNIFIFGIFHPDIRKALQNLFCGKDGSIGPDSDSHIPSHQASSSHMYSQQHGHQPHHDHHLHHDHSEHHGHHDHNGHHPHLEHDGHHDQYGHHPHQDQHGHQGYREKHGPPDHHGH